MPTPPRACYFRHGGPRPLWRGRMMAACLPGWWVVALLHFAGNAPVAQSVSLLVARAAVDASTALSVLASDRYHNSDRAAAPSCDAERRWLRVDLAATAWVLASSLALWAAHLAFAGPLAGLVAAAVALAAAATLLAAAVDRGGPRAAAATQTAVKAVYAVLYFGLPPALLATAWREGCGLAPTAVWLVYLPGLVSYATGRPREDGWWGAHEVMHAFVLLGHAAGYAADTAVLFDGRCRV